MLPPTENTNPQKIFIGASWPYASGNIHVGHLAGQYIVCDVFARYHRLIGNKVLMVSGSDSHGAPVVFAAEEQNISPEELVEKSHAQIKDTYKKLGLLYENYSSTHTENHSTVVQNIFLALKEFGYLFIEKSEQYYDPKVGRFLPDRYVRGTCPNCGATNARGDECPECGKFLDPVDLIDPYSTLSDAKPVMKETQHFYLDLKKVEPELKEWLKDKDYWRNWVIEFTRGWLREGLLPRAITRDMDFGVKVPVEGWEGKVVYVWLEAVVGYLSAAIEWAQNQGDPSLWEEYWKDPECKHYYFIAGGNVPFHTVIWPAELIAYNQKYKSPELFERYKLPGETKSSPLNLPFDVPANKMLMYHGKKMSKGDKTGITLDKLLETFNPDLLRYFFIKYAPETGDREYIWKDLIEANNNELVANIGNFINRALVFTQTKFEGKVPKGKLDSTVKEQIEIAFNESSKTLENCEFIKSIEVILNLGHFANKYFNDQKPWETVKSDPKASANTLYNSIQIVSALQTLLKPFLPATSDKILSSLKLNEGYDANKELETTGKVQKYENSWIFNEVPFGHQIETPEILFEKLEYTEELKREDEYNPDAERAKSITLTQTDEVKHIPIVWKVLTDLSIKKRSNASDKWIDVKTKEIINKYDSENWSERPELSAYKELHNKYSEEKDLPGSGEGMIQFIKEKGSVPNINTFVDIYNIVSALTGVSIGAHDLGKIGQDPKLEILKEDTSFRTINSTQGTAKKGEYAYTDSKGILCRLDIKQGERTKITEKTQNVLVIFQGNSAIGEEDLEKALQLLEEGLKTLSS